MDQKYSYILQRIDENDNYFDDCINIKPDCSDKDFCIFLKAFSRIKEDIECAVMILEELQPSNNPDSTFCYIANHAEHITFRIVDAYDYMDKYYRNKLLYYFPEEVKDIIYEYFDDMLCYDASFYSNYLSLTEDICYYSNYECRSNRCNRYMEYKKELEFILDDYRHEAKVTKFTYESIFIFLNKRYINEYNIPDVEINILIVSFLYDDTFIKNYDAYIETYQDYFMICRSIKKAKKRDNKSESDEDTESDKYTESDEN